jgi:osmotically-inducible protein OsmY
MYFSRRLTMIGLTAVLARVDTAIKAQPTLKDQDIDSKLDNKVVTGEAITDAWINTKIHSKMLDEATLKGTVTSEAGKARAEHIARTTDGAKNVTNLLTIGAKK